MIFILGMFWKKATPNSALVAAIGSALLSLLLKLAWPQLPFMDRVGAVFVVCIALAVIVSLVENKTQSGAIDLEGVNFSTTSSFNFASIGLTLILAALYATWWWLQTRRTW